MVGFELSVYAELPAAPEDEGCTFPAPKTEDDEVLLNSLLDGAAKALFASPVAEDATLLSSLFIVFAAELVEVPASSSFEASAFPFPFESLILQCIRRHHNGLEERRRSM